MKPVSTFRSAGDRGDIIGSLPVIRHFGGGILYIEAAAYTRERLTPDNWAGLDILLKKQDYIVDVLPYVNQPITVNLNDFRAVMHRSLRKGSGKAKALWDWMLETHSCPVSAAHERWLEVEPYNPGFKYVVFSRSGAGRQPQYCYHNHAFPWRLVWDKYHEQAMFVGTKNEYENFCATVGKVKWMPTKNLDEAAQVISGCSLFIGNQSACHMIAEGLKKNIVLEVWQQGPNTLSFRPGVQHGWDNHVLLPDL